MEQFSDNKIDFQNNYLKEDAYLRAKKRLDKVVGFYWHLAVYIVINLIIIAIIVTKSNRGLTHYGTYATAFFWGIGLLFHFLGVFGPNFLFGKNWEQRKIKEYMERDAQQFNRFE